jgi:hypothetical protein
MQKQRGFRLGLVSLLAVIALGVMAFAAPASASTTSVTIHARICPSSGVTDYFTDCHPNPVTNAAFRLDHRTSRFVNGATGNLTFHDVTAGSHIVALTAGDQPNEFLHLRAYCSDANTGSPAVEETVHSTSQASFRVSVSTGQRIVCDVYWIPESAA